MTQFSFDEMKAAVDVAEGAYADVILVDGNPLADIDMISRDYVRVVVKDGEIFKNTLEA